MKFFIFLFWGMTGIVFANETPNSHHHHLHGVVYGLEEGKSKQDTIPLAKANIFWNNSTIGTTTDKDGFFHLQRPENEEGLLVFNYVGYENDTLHVNQNDNNLTIYLKTIPSMEEIYVSGEKPNTIHNRALAINTESITSSGLSQLACCSLAESFESTASVEVEQSDAVSGARRIKMLGLAGFYTQMMIEKKPVMRGLITPYALEYIPGFWMESVNISKGTASVATGYESITGQINVELKKSENSESFAANGYVNSMDKTDVSLLAEHQFSPNLSTMLLTYATYLNQKWDTNDDSFIDMPLTKQFNIMNRWKYSGEKFEGQVGFKTIYDDRQGGQKDFDFNNPGKSAGIYGSEYKIRRYEFFSKNGFVLDNQGSSVGLVLSVFQHSTDAFAGEKNYTGDESSLYANLTINKNLSEHKISTGLSYQYDDREETYLTEKYDSSERVPGMFAEYTYQPNDKITAMAGLRYDNHNRFGSFYTPRAHIKYTPTEKTSIRLSAGSGYRNPHIFADNPAILASSKEVIFLENPDVEQAWNVGLQITQDFTIGAEKPATLVLDFYRTEFLNQVVMDMEQSAQHIYLYNLDGKSYSNALQAELSTTVFEGFDLTLAGRYNDVKTTYQDKLESVPLNSLYKGLVVLSYNTSNDKWQMDLTTQFNSKARLPNTTMNPEEYQLDKYSPNYVLLFAQVKRKFENWEIYAGVENLTNFRQENPIMAWQEPFSPYFDSSAIWGPTFGRRFYVGFRFH